MCLTCFFDENGWQARHNYLPGVFLGPRGVGAVGSSAASANFHQTTRCHVPDYITLQDVLISTFDSRQGQNISLLHSFRAAFGAQPASCPVGTGGDFPGGKAAVV
jgi:hypothetical protein